MQIAKSIVAAPAAALLLVMAFTGAASASLKETAGPFIMDLGQRVIEVFVDTEASQSERAERFSNLFNEGFAVEALAKFTLGHYSEDADNAFLDEYLRVFDEYVVLSYLSRFASDVRPQMAIATVRPDRDPSGKEVGVIVESNVWFPGGRPATVSWRVREYRGNPIIVDVVARGISLAIHQQREFTSVISNNGGDVRALLAALREKNSAMREE